MADEVVINGVASDEQTGESFSDLDQRGDNDARVADLSRKIESLEHEKLRLVHENAETKERIKRLTAEIEELRYEEASTKEKLGEMEKEIERSEDARKALEATAARAAELETEVSTLQDYLISTLSDSDEANRELFGLKRVLKEKGVRVENLERMVESLKREKVEGEKRVRDLERKVGVLEMKEIEEKSKKVRIEEEMRDRIGEKEREIDGFRKKAEDLESAIAKNGVELEKWMREKPGLEALVKESEEQANLMELKVIGLQKEVSRLQHDLLSKMSDGHEAKKELIGSKRVLEEKGVRVENLERMVESLEREKVEGEKRVRDLERKVGVLEMKEIEEKSKKVRIEEEMRDRIGEKEREINGFRKKAEDLESAVAKNGVELEKWMREKLGLEALVKAKSMELKVFRLQKEVEEAEKVIHGLKEKAAEAINGSVNEIMATAGAAEKGLKLDWPVVAAGSTGAIALAAAVAYMIDVKLR